MNPYDKEARLAVIKEAKESAAQVMPIICAMFNPRSILDVGCAEGVWLAEALKSESVERIHGIDDGWAAGHLMIPKDDFTEVNLEGDLPHPALIKSSAYSTKPEMAICLEVAEHISPKAGMRLVDFLCNAAPVVVFSAAIPGQGGVGHINEQWQSYWAKIFNIGGYYPHTQLREAIWNLPGVQPYYKQNIIVYTQSVVNRSPWMLDIVHPDFYKYKMRIS